MTKIMKKKIEEEIGAVLLEMRNTKQCSEEYAILAKRLETLLDVRYNKNPNTLAETGLKVGGNIVAVLLVLYFEKTDTVLSKAFNLIRGI